MSIKKKVEKITPKNKFVKKIENTLFDIIDTDEPVHVYMHTDVCRMLQEQEASVHISDKYISGEYHLKQLSRGSFEKTLEVVEALYQTCLRFEKADLALIVTSEVTRALLQFKIALTWLDGRFSSGEEITE